MQIQRKINFQTIPEMTVETQNQEKSASRNVQRDSFESKIEVQKESALLEKTKAETDYYKRNVDGSVNSKDVDQVAEDQNKKYSEAKENFKDAIQMMQEYLERQKAAYSKIRS